MLSLVELTRSVRPTKFSGGDASVDVPTFPDPQLTGAKLFQSAQGVAESLGARLPSASSKPVASAIAPGPQPVIGARGCGPARAESAVRKEWCENER